MAISNCNLTINSKGMELVNHGTTAFPIACYEESLRNLEIAWHWHQEFEMIYVTAGALTLFLGDCNHPLTLKAGNGIFINSGVLHQIKNGMDLETPGILRSIVFHPRLIGGGLDSIF